METVWAIPCSTVASYPLSRSRHLGSTPVWCSSRTGTKNYHCHQLTLAPSLTQTSGLEHMGLISQQLLWDFWSKLLSFSGEALLALCWRSHLSLASPSGTDLQIFELSWLRLPVFNCPVLKMSGSPTLACLIAGNEILSDQSFEWTICWTSPERVSLTFGFQNSVGPFWSWEESFPKCY